MGMNVDSGGGGEQLVGEKHDSQLGVYSISYVNE
jgi:hypothetical protein